MKRGLGLARKEGGHATFASGGTLGEVLKGTAKDFVGGPVGLLALC